jgi:L-lactate utilization protein LutB
MNSHPSSSPAADSPKENVIVRHGSPRPVSSHVIPRESAWGLLLQKTGLALQKRGFSVSIAASLGDAAALVMDSLLPAAQKEIGVKTVSFGGSMTVLEAGLLDALKARPELEVMDTFDMSIGAPAMLELRRRSLLCDLFLCSVNALSRDGQLVLVDGQGNRTAAVQYGPRKVILLVGRNKICTTVEAAFDRVKGMASPANAMRLDKKTPCAKTGYCMDCNSPDRICTVWALLQRCFPAGRIHVVLIDEEAGF